MADQAFDDIANSILGMRTAFEAHGMEPPKTVLLPDHDAGRRLLSVVRGSDLVVYDPGSVGQPIEHPDGSVWMEFKVCGVGFRWPARKFAKPNGDFVWG